MFDSRTVSTQIARPVAEVYDFLMEPMNLSKWWGTLGDGMEHVEGRDWRLETSTGPVIIRFGERNKLGVLDFALLREGQPPAVTPLRVFANGEGAEIAYTLFRAEGMSDDAFNSEAEWVAADFTVLKTYLEARNLRR